MQRATTGLVYHRAGLAELDTSAALHVPGHYERVPGELFGAGEEVEAAFRALQDASPVGLDPTASGTLADPIVVGGGMVLTTDGRVASESLNCIENLAEYRGFHRSADKRTWTADEAFEITKRVPAVPGRQHVLLKSAWDANYGHWLFDTLSKLPLVDSLQLEDRPLFVVSEHSGAMAKVVLDSLALAGYGPDDIVQHDFDIRQYESLTVLGSLTRHPTTKSPLAMQHLDSLAASIEPGAIKRVYLTRNSYRRRRLVNEALLWPQFEELGFVRVTPEALSLSEQIALFKGARVVAGNLGASFSNLAFAPDGIEVLALTTQGMKHDFFYDIVCLKQGRYVALQGITSDRKPTLSSDFHIEGFALRQVLSQLT